MKILFVLHMYPPLHNAGGETTAHSAMRAMLARGHTVEIICKPHCDDIRFEPYELEGIKVTRPPESINYLHQWLLDYVARYQPDIILTHLDLTFTAMQLALDSQRPIAHMVHNSNQLKYHRVNEYKCQLAIFNSNWVAEAEQWRGPQVVVHPVVEPERYKCPRGTKITLINPTPGKGEYTFYQLSRMMPDYEFLVVKSVYGEQVFPPNINADKFPNVEFMDHTADVREVFSKTKVLLVPSEYESYGRVAVEAACCGIPSIAHPTEGLLESIGAESPDDLIQFTRSYLKRHRPPTPERLKGGWISGAGIFCDRDDLETWKGQLERLYSDEIYYRSRSDAALRLAHSLEPEKEFDRLEQALIKTVNDWQDRNEVAKVAMWTSDRRIWETSDGLVAEVNGRIPGNATRLAAGIGTELPEEVAIKYGFIPPKEPPETPEPEKTTDESEAKAFDAPAENKAIAAPQEKKTRKPRERKTA